MKMGDSSFILSAKLINVSDNTEIVLFENQQGTCHISKEPVTHGKYVIQLRLDWEDIKNTDPTLDADVWLDKKDDKHRVQNGQWHHTIKEKTENGYLYKFKFQELELRLISKITVGQTIKSDACIKKPDPHAGL